MQNYKICPYCGGALDAGWVSGRDGVCWTPKKTFFVVFSDLVKGAIRLENRKNANNTYAHAYRCPTCKVVIIPYDRFDLDE